MKWLLTLILVCASLMATDAEHLFTCSFCGSFGGFVRVLVFNLASLVPLLLLGSLQNSRVVP